MNMKITKSNAIINASYRLSLNEQRIILYGLSHIDPTSDEFPLFHRIHIKDLAKSYNIGEKDRGSFYDDIRHTLLNKFWTREFSYYDEDLGEVVRRNWLAEIRYGRKDGTLAYHYNPLIKSQLQQLAKRFTSYFLSNVANMKSAYSMRFYEIAVMYLNASNLQKTVFNKTISELKQRLDIETKYKKFSDLKRRVLEHARKEINKHSDITLNYEVIKLGRSPHEIKFTITRKKGRERQEKQLTFDGDIKPTQRLSSKTLEKAKELTLAAKTGWDFYVIEQQFYDFIKTKNTPDNLDGAFIGFVKKKIAKKP